MQVSEMDSGTTFEAYEDENGRWRWRLWNGRGRIVASSGEAYASQVGALRAAEAVRQVARDADVATEPGLGIAAAVRLRELIADPSPAPAPFSAAEAAPASVPVRATRKRRRTGTRRQSTLRAVRGEPLRLVRP
jgi:uncharacterized protein YegP (UPF0339 family)